MKTSAMYGLLCALLVLSACTKSLTIDEGQGNAGAAGASAGEAGQAGEAGEAGGSAGEAGEAGGSAGEAGGSAGEAGGSAGEAGGSAGAAGGEDDGPGGSTAGAPLATTRWTGNAPSCPASPQFSGACDVEEGLVCGYYYEEGGDTQYSECACQMHCAEGGTELRWVCSGYGGNMLEQCPAEQPEQGSDCFGKKGVTCNYPVKVTCDCPSDPNDSSWRCVNDSEIPREHPEDVDPNAIVADLTAEQRAAWCAWYVPPTEPGFPEPEVEEADENGFYPDTGCSAGSYLGCNTTQPGGLPRQACEANLELSTCEASVYELTDCVITSAGGAGPAPNGCARFFASPGCSGTIVNQISGGPNVGIGLPGDNSCRVRVE